MWSMRSRASRADRFVRRSIRGTRSALRRGQSCLTLGGPALPSSPTRPMPARGSISVAACSRGRRGGQRRRRYLGTLNAVLDRFAWIVQHPGEPLAGRMVLLGPQGVGKDALLLPLAYALGWWNTANVTARRTGRPVQSLRRGDLVIVNEVRIVHRDGGAHQFYSRLKSLARARPTRLQADEKNMPVR